MPAVTNPKAAMRRIREKYPYHVILKIEGQPRPDRMTESSWGPFGRVVEASGKTNRWCFSSEEMRREFINLYGGDIPV